MDDAIWPRISSHIPPLRGAAYGWTCTAESCVTKLNCETTPVFGSAWTCNLTVGSAGSVGTKSEPMSMRGCCG